MLTPKDIVSAEFKRQWKGYSAQQVDEFLRRVVTEYEALYKENQQLKERVAELKEHLDGYTRTEAQIDETLRLARQASQDVKAAAEREAESVVQRAKVRADEVLRDAQDRLRDQLVRLEELQRQERSFRERLRQLLEGYLNLLADQQRVSVRAGETVSAAAAALAAAEEPGADAADPLPVAGLEKDPPPPARAGGDQEVPLGDLRAGEEP